MNEKNNPAAPEMVLSGITAPNDRVGKYVHTNAGDLAIMPKMQGFYGVTEDANDTVGNDS